MRDVRRCDLRPPRKAVLTNRGTVHVIAVGLPTDRLALGVACAVGAALSYALSNVLQQHEAEQLPQQATLKLGLLRQLARRPRWLAGVGADVAGFVLEALALGAGTLVLVEPILSTSLLLSLFLGASINRRQISKDAWIAAIVLAVGVALFLDIAAPTAGTQLASQRTWLVAAPLILGFVLICVTSAQASSGSSRAAFLGAAAGTLFGTSAVLTKAFVHYLADGVFNWIPHWEPYALAVSSIAGLVLSQSAFQTGALAAAIGSEQVLQPLTGVAIGVGMLNEHLEISGSIPAILMLAAVASMLWGILALARAEDEHSAIPPPAIADG